MIMDTKDNYKIDSEFVAEYLGSLVNGFFKVIPMKENHEESLSTYMRSLKFELLGCKSLIYALQSDSLYLSLLAVLQSLIDNNDNPDFSFADFRREVFKAISICKKLKSRYMEAGSR